MAPFISFLFSMVFSSRSSSFPSQIPCQRNRLADQISLSSDRRMWVYRVNSSATHPLRDQSFSSVVNILSTRGLKWTQALVRVLRVTSAMLGNICVTSVTSITSVTLVTLVTSSRFYSIHPSAPSVEVHAETTMLDWLLESTLRIRRTHCEYPVCKCTL